MIARLSLLRLVLAWLLVNGLVMIPLWIGAAVTGGATAAWLAIEAGLIVGFLALVPSLRVRWLLVAGVTLLLVLATLIGFASLVFQVSLGRPFNLFLDLYLVGSVYELAVANVGLAKTIGAVLLIVVALTAGPLLLSRLLDGPPSGPPRTVKARRVAVLRRQRRQHSLQYGRVEGRRRGVV